jgi:hypothetical protein
LVKEGHAIAITSFNNYPDVMEMALDMLELPKEIREKINVLSGFPVDMNKGKGEHIGEGMQLEGIRKNSYVLLIDDDTKNTEAAEKNGHATIHVKEGFSWKEVWQKVKEMALEVVKQRSLEVKKEAGDIASGVNASPAADSARSCHTLDFGNNSLLQKRKKRNEEQGISK